jgi:protein-L-isoaspartate O-methyltransferase
VIVREGDGYRGWPEKAPFDGIIVTAGRRLGFPSRCSTSSRPAGAW